MTGINKANLQEIQRLIEVLDEHITSKVFKLSGGLKLLNENNEVLGFISHGEDGWEFSTPVNSVPLSQYGYGHEMAQQSVHTDRWKLPPPKITKGGLPMDSRHPGSGEPIVNEEQ